VNNVLPYLPFAESYPQIYLYMYLVILLRYHYELYKVVVCTRGESGALGSSPTGPLASKEIKVDPFSMAGGLFHESFSTQSLEVVWKGAGTMGMDPFRYLSHFGTNLFESAF
jgi:hypothetical protein